VRSDLGQCGLCQEMRVLQESHLLPAALYKLARDPSRTNPNPVMITRGRAFTTSHQIADRFLCGECEERFSNGGERYVLGQCARPSGDFKVRELLEKAIPFCEDPQFRVFDVAGLLGLRTDEYLCFAASVFWRASARAWSPAGTSRERFPLGDAYQEQFRLYLLGRAGSPGNGRLLVHIWSDKATDFTTIAPCTSRVDGERRHKFCIPGITFILFLGGQVPRRHDGGALNSTQGKFMWLCPWMNDSLFWGIRQFNQAVCPSGVSASASPRGQLARRSRSSGRRSPCPGPPTSAG